VAVGSLALGIGANTIIFTVAKGVLLDRLAVARPGELRLLEIVVPKDNSPIYNSSGNFDRDSSGGMRTSSFSYPVYELLRAQNAAHPVMQELFAHLPLPRGRPRQQQIR
jgi:hypothetical protein